MNENQEKVSNYMGTYFDRSTIIRVSRWAEISSWIVAVVYILDLIVALGVFILSNMRGFWVGLGFTDYVQNVLFIIERPFRGIAYFFALQAIGKALLILMDMEDNTRRAARK
jgi:hypothetical protein